MLGQTITSTSIFNIVFLVFPIMFFSMFGYAIYAAVKNNRKYQNQLNVTLTKKIIKKKTADNIATGVLFVVFSMFTCVAIVMNFAVKPESIDAKDLKVFNILKYSFAGVAILVFIALLFSLKSLIRTRVAINNNEFVIFVDVLGDKDEETTTDSDGHSSTDYYFYFKYLFRNLKKRISTTYVEYKDAQIGDEFFIVYVIPTNKAVSFKVGKYQLDYELRSKLIETSNLDNYIQDNNNADNANEYNVPIDEKALLEKYKISNSTNNNLIIAAILFVVTIIFICFLVARSFGTAGFVGIFVVVLFVCIEENIKKNTKAKQAIFEGKYNVISTVITEDVTDNHIKSSDKFLYFKVKYNDFEIKCPAKDFKRAGVGDEIYLFYFHQGIFINNSEPFAVINPNKEHLAHNIINKLYI